MIESILPYLIILGLCLLLWRQQRRASRSSQLSRSLHGAQVLPAGSADDANEEARRLRTTLDSMSQGVSLIGRDGRLETFNRKVCEILDLPASFMATRPSYAEIVARQSERGDFGADGILLEENARHKIVTRDLVDVPTSYRRKTKDGKTLEVRTGYLPDGRVIRTFDDITARHQAELALKESAERLQLALDGADMAIWDLDFTTGQVYLSEKWSEMRGGPHQASVENFGTTVDLLPADDRITVAAAMEPALKGQIDEYRVEHRALRLDGSLLRVITQGRVTERGADGRAKRAIGTILDVTSRREAEAALHESETRWKLALESTGDGVWDWNLETGTEVFSRRIKEMYGYAEDEIDDWPAALDERTHPEDLAGMLQARQEHLVGRSPSYSNEHRVRCRDGSWKWILSRGAVISRDAEGRALRMIGTHTDITERKNAEALIWQQANYDSLTGLPNRRMLRDHLTSDAFGS